jgi:hypothetical protein
MPSSKCLLMPNFSNIYVLKSDEQGPTLRIIFFPSEQVSFILQHNLPPKFKNPGASTISCIIGDYKIDKVLLYWGAGVNQLPYSNYLQLGLRELKPTPIIFQLADRSTKKPRGIIEDVII